MTTETAKNMRVKKMSGHNAVWSIEMLLLSSVELWRIPVRSPNKARIWQGKSVGESLNIAWNAFTKINNYNIPAKTAISILLRFKIYKKLWAHKSVYSR